MKAPHMMEQFTEIVIVRSGDGQQREDAEWLRGNYLALSLHPSFTIYKMELEMLPGSCTIW